MFETLVFILVVMLLLLAALDLFVGVVTMQQTF